MAAARRWILGSAVPAAALGCWLSAGGAAPPALPLDDAHAPAATLLVTFGLRDTAPRAWDGSLGANPDAAWVEADRFRVHEPVAAAFSAAGSGTASRGEARFPNDYLPSPTSWVASTREAPLHGPTTEWNVRTEQPAPILQPPSVLVHLQAAAHERPLAVRTANGTFEVLPRTLAPFLPRLFLDGAVRVERVPTPIAVAPDRLAQQDFPSIAATRAGALWVAWQELDGASDTLVARRRLRAGWGPAEVVARGDLFRSALAEDAAGRVWALWSAQADGDWELFGRAHDGRTWLPAERLTRSPGADIYHRAVTDERGRLWLVWQRGAGARGAIVCRSFDGRRWSEETVLSDSGGASVWWPVLAAGPGGRLAAAWDGYAGGSYDIYLRRHDGARWGPVERVAGTPRFEAHPTIAIDPSGRVWLAWNESGPEWGKDTGFLVARKGTQLHESRAIRIVCLEGEHVLTTRGPLPEVLAAGDFWELPHLELDARGNPWLLARRLLMREPDTPLEGPIDLALWDIYATRYDGARWSEPMKLPRSAGRNDMMPATARLGSGAIWAAWPTDSRSTRSFLPHQLRVEAAELPRIDASAAPDLVPYTPAVEPATAIHPREAEAVARIRAYRVASGGRTYAIYRGDLHRHTDISVDGCNDGSLLDAYRYAVDAAALDFLGVSDHNGAVDEPAAWWLSQKTADLFQADGRFVAFYGYERSLEYPNGHRNVFYLQKGGEITPISGAENRGWEGAERLFWALRRSGGISIPHTSGRTSGTDWRDNDPEVEPLVEIYQGMRDSYEHPEAPRPKRLLAPFPDPSRPVPRASSRPASPSFRPLGFVWQALAKGFRLGFIASSDHISGHVSYACVLAERLTRESLFEAIRARRTYGATDNIVLDARFHGSDGEHLMGEEFASASPVRVAARVQGTGAIERIEVIRDGAVVFSRGPGPAEQAVEFADTAARPGRSYYYVRVLQTDGEMAWSSPAWVTYAASGRSGRQ